MVKKHDFNQSKESGFELINKVEIRIQDASLLSLSRSASINPECCGWLYVLNLKGSQFGRDISLDEDNWEQYYFTLKGGMMFGSSKKDGSTLEVVYVLCDTVISTIDSITALQREYITREEEATLRQNIGKDVHLIILLHYNNSLGIESNPLIFAASSPNVSARWCIAMNQSVQYGQMRYFADNSDQELEDGGFRMANSMKGEFGGMTGGYYRGRDINQLSQQLEKLRHQFKQMEVENKSLKSKNESLQNQVKRLQSTLTVTEKATSEAVEQKAAELTQVREDLSNVRGEKELLIEEKNQLHERISQLMKNNQQILLEKFEVMDELTDLQDNISSYKSGDAGLSKLITRLQYLKNSSQELLIENRKYKNEIKSILDHYREEQEKSTQQLNMIKELLSQQDVFQLLIRQIELVQAKLQYQQEAWRMPDNQAENLLFWIQQLQNQWKVDEAVARASYLKHRSIVLGEQMKAYTLGHPLPTHYAIIQELLHKLQYIFREEEFSVVTRSEFLYEDIGNANSGFEPLNIRNQMSKNQGKGPIWDGENFKQPPLSVLPSIFGNSKSKMAGKVEEIIDESGNAVEYAASGSIAGSKSLQLREGESGLIEYSSLKSSIMASTQYIPKIQVDLLSPPEKNVPESEYERIKNSYREIQEKYRILEGENEIMSEKIQKLTKMIKSMNKKTFRQSTRSGGIIDFPSGGNLEESSKSNIIMDSGDNNNSCSGELEHNKVIDSTDSSHVIQSSRSLNKINSAKSMYNDANYISVNENTARGPAGQSLNTVENNISDAIN
ncbi:putative coiled coil-containing protein [Cryptosporidium canis]|uniref:Coiled coil-containing protein n=1 Tax=Cryptosporidium canis TaxID=195482 RepID=A0ABQ8P6F3_9CRYT|nr:putative coiled coil-containing protein [Cryptosporidium canis]KAJ1608540.1 putative coiled coil-containing protein [Cryptosporidium canis]